jgi:type III pantothenate kinase
MLSEDQVGTVREIKNKIIIEVFTDDAPVVIGTGGFSSLFESEGLFDLTLPTLVLKGLLNAYKLNNVQNKEV